MQLPLYLREDRVFFGGHQKRGYIGGTVEEEKSEHLSECDSFMGMRDHIGDSWRCS
jgi:hypothetical protein